MSSIPVDPNGITESTGIVIKRGMRSIGSLDMMETVSGPFFTSKESIVPERKESNERNYCLC